MNISLSSQPQTTLKPTKRRLLKRFLLKLICWIEYPTPRERMWGMYEMGKRTGKQEILKQYPLIEAHITGPQLPVKVLPQGVRKQPSQPLPDWVLQVQQPIQIEDCSWLNDQPVIQPIFDKEATLQVPAIMQFLHKTKQGVQGNG